MSAEQLRGLADIATRFGTGAVRLTVWQNLLISDVADANLPAAKAAIMALGFDVAASSVRGALVACTGNTGCKFALGDTKRHGLELATYLEARVALDQPMNIHLTGCPHSCAQHLVADIGLLASKVEQGEEMLEGYTISVGGGAGAQQRLGREVFPAAPFAEVSARVEGLLAAYLTHRAAATETFHTFAGRHGIDDLRRMAEAATGGTRLAS
jgi:ferredoxin-nitrite reductase